MTGVVCDISAPVVWPLVLGVDQAVWPGRLCRFSRKHACTDGHHTTKRCETNAKQRMLE
jgi:hypothetical protein